MKAFKYILACLVLLSAFSCTKDDEMVIYNPENAVSGTLNAIESDYTLLAEEENSVFEDFSWSASKFGFSAAIEYVLEADLADKKFENPVEVFAVKKALSSDVTVGTINTVMMNLQRVYDFEEGETQEVAFRLRSSISEAATPIYSNIISTNITPYSGTPTEMYMIGQDFGGWNWTTDGVVEMIPVNDQEGQFWCIRYFTTGNGFKWSPVKDWDKSFNKLTTNQGFTFDNNNAYIDADGLYMVFIDYKNNKIVMEPAQIFGIGEAFNGWEGDPVAFTIDGKKASIVVKNNDDLRMYAVCSAAPNRDWWRWEFIILDGNIVYRGNGGEQERVNVTAGQTVTLDFNIETGTIQ